MKYISALIIINLFLFMIILLVSGYLFLFDFISELCNKIREFITKNESFFDISFLILFSFEQALLFYLIYKLRIQHSLFQLAIGIFVIVVIGTATLQKIVLNIKYKQLKVSINDLTMEAQRTIGEQEQTINIIKAKYINKEKS